MRALVIVIALAAACGTEPVEEQASALCVLDPGTISQRAAVLAATTTDSRCEPAATAAATDAAVDVDRGLVLGAPLQVTALTSYDGASVGARCVFDVRATARPAIPIAGGGSCGVAIDLWLRVVRP